MRFIQPEVKGREVIARGLSRRNLRPDIDVSLRRPVAFCSFSTITDVLIMLILVTGWLAKITKPDNPPALGHDGGLRVRNHIVM